MYLVAAAVLVVAATGIALAVRHHRSMCTALLALQTENQADTVFKSDSAALRLVRHFDSPACLLGTSNDRMLAHYLLGRAHADMDDAPAAIQDYYDAIECADTTAKDCDFRILRNIYGQMAAIFDAQNLPEDEIEAQRRCNYYSLLIGDTTSYLNGIRFLENPYFILGYEDSILYVDSIARSELLRRGDRKNAARTLIVPASIHNNHNQFEEAKNEISIIRRDAQILDEETLLPLRRYEMILNIIGENFIGFGQLDSAEYYFRRLFQFQKYEAGYAGLLSVYEKLEESDSIIKYARLYADANDAGHDKMRTEEVKKTSALYNYNRSLKEAEHQEKRARLFSNISLMAFVIIVLSIFMFSLYHHRNKMRNERREQYLLRITSDYTNLVQSYSKTESELQLLENDYSEYRATKERDLEVLKAAKQHFEELWLRSDISNHFTEFVKYSFVAKLIRMSDPKSKEYASQHEWEQCIEFFKKCFPSFMDIVGERSMDIKDWKIIIVCILGFSPAMSADALNVSEGSVTEYKRRANRKLFNEYSAATFVWNLNRAIFSITANI